MSTNSSTTILWPSLETIETMALTQPFSPVNRWDAEARRFTDVQDETAEGLPIWQAEALIRTGYRAALTPVQVRYAGLTAPSIKPDAAKLAAAVGAAAEGGEDW